MSRTVLTCFGAVVAAALLVVSCGETTNPPLTPEQNRGGAGDGGAQDDGGTADGGADGGTDAGAQPDGGTDGGADGGADGGELPSYAAQFLAGGLDRIRVDRALTTTQPRCAQLFLVSPAMSVGDGGFTAPSGWSLQDVIVRDRACGSGAGSGTTVSTTDAFGSATFTGDAGSGFPTHVSVHATAFFTGNPDGGFPPAQVRFDVDQVLVQ